MIDRHRCFIVYPAAVFAAFLILFTLSGCGEGLPKGIRQQADSLPDAIEAATAFVSEQQKKYRKLTASKPFRPIARFAKEEKWAHTFTRADQDLVRAMELYKTELAPLIRKNRPESTSQVQSQIDHINKIISDAKAMSQSPALRFTRIQNAIANMASYRADAGDHARQIREITRQLESNPFEKAFADFPDNKDGLNARMAPFLELEERAGHHLEVIDTVFHEHQTGADPNYAAFTDSAAELTRGLETARQLRTATEKEVEQLYTSYSKILKDMKVVYRVTIKRESWDERSDYYNPSFATFQRDVSAAAYDTITADTVDNIAEIKASYGRSRLVNKIGNTWNELSINPVENWRNSSHNAAAFWVEDAREFYFHKYILETNGTTRETDWETVDGQFYNANLEHLGMAILAKPYGTFEKDRLTQAAPPGMAYVGNPQYGEWKKDESGDRFWSWYGRYAFFSNLFFFPPYYYGYHSWHGWHRDYRYKKPYFGKTKEGFQKFGTSGTFIRKSPTFQGTAFAKSGGLKSQSASVRGAGAGLRGGGPKGKGK